MSFLITAAIVGEVKCCVSTVLQSQLFDDGRFILENWVLDRWVRNILTIYPVVIVALVGNVYKHFNPADPTPNAIFMGEFSNTYLSIMIINEPVFFCFVWFGVSGPFEYYTGFSCMEKLLSPLKCCL